MTFSAAAAALQKLAPPAAAAPAAERSAPQAPITIAETGISLNELLNLFTKTIYTAGESVPSVLAEQLKLPARTIQLIIEQAQERKLLDVLGTGRLGEMRYALTEKGKTWALDALNISQYLGPCPVPLSGYIERLKAQSILNEQISPAAVRDAFRNLIITDIFVQDIGPAINSGRAILMYGPPGNGKTTISERIGNIFNDVIYIPHCIEVEGQIIKLFDPILHKPVNTAADATRSGLRRSDFDARWVACKRPFIVVGGELTLGMLDLRYNESAKFYEAPLHVKALNGIFMIDDFGRQIVSPTQLLNRWIVPLESRIEFMKLHTGKSFSLPFDELIVFGTNLEPRDLMDQAFLRRIPYKLEVLGPNPDQFRVIFRNVAKKMGFDAPDSVIDMILAELAEKKVKLANFQSAFIMNQIVAACKFEGITGEFRTEHIKMALRNLHMDGKLPPEGGTLANV